MTHLGTGDAWIGRRFQGMTTALRAGRRIHASREVVQANAADAGQQKWRLGAVGVRQEAIRKAIAFRSAMVVSIGQPTIAMPDGVDADQEAVRSSGIPGCSGYVSGHADVFTDREEAGIRRPARLACICGPGTRIPQLADGQHDHKR